MLQSVIGIGQRGALHGGGHGEGFPMKLESHPRRKRRHEREPPEGAREIRIHGAAPSSDAAKPRQRRSMGSRSANSPAYTARCQSVTRSEKYAARDGSSVAFTARSASPSVAEGRIAMPYRCTARESAPR